MFPVFPFSVRRACAVGTALAVGCSATISAHAARPATALPPGVRQLLDDLRSIAPGSTVTDEQKQTLADDLTALASGLVKPSSSSVDQLADDLAAAAASGRLTRKVEKLLAGDLAAVLDRAELDPARLRAVVAEVTVILAAYGIDAADLQQLAADLETIIDGFQTDSVSAQQTITLQAENLPTFLPVNYSGRAKLATVHAEGQATQTVLSLSVSGLPAANPYTVAVTRRSDGGRVVLGRLRVRACGREVIGKSASASAGTVLPQAELDTQGETVFGGPGGKPLPDGFDPADVDTLTLTDANGTERLAGSFVEAGDLQSRTRLVNLRVDAGAADPGASGAVSFRAKTTGTKTRDAFLLYVAGLPAGAVVTLVADGAAVGEFTTTGQGQLVISEGLVPVPTSTSGRMLPVNALPASVDLDTLGALTLTDAAGNVLAGGGQ